MQSAHLALNLQPMDMARLCGEVATQISPAVRAKKQHLEVNVPPVLPTVYADPPAPNGS